MVQVNRNQNVPETGVLSKSLTKFDFPTQLRLDTFSDSGAQYKYFLHAILIHDGSPFYGHYYVFILDRKNKQWWKFNDSQVTRVDWEEVKKESEGGFGSKAASNLFYIDEEMKESFEKSDINYWE
jgi:uncharacterized UBP type Zn finger protein